MHMEVYTYIKKSFFKILFDCLFRLISETAWPILTGLSLADS